MTFDYLLLFGQRREEASDDEVHPGHCRLQFRDCVRQQPRVDPHPAVGGVEAGRHLRQEVLERVQPAREGLAEVRLHLLVVGRRQLGAVVVRDHLQSVEDVDPSLAGARGGIVCVLGLVDEDGEAVPDDARLGGGGHGEGVGVVVGQAEELVVVRVDRHPLLVRRDAKSADLERSGDVLMDKHRKRTTEEIFWS